MASFGIAKGGLASYKYTCKLDKGTKQIQICAKDREYLEDIAALLYYPGNPPEGIIKDPAEEDRDSKPTKAAGTKGGNHRGS